VKGARPGTDMPSRSGESECSTDRQTTGLVELVKNESFYVSLFTFHLSQLRQPAELIPIVDRLNRENVRSFIFYQNEGAFGRIIGQGCSTR